MASINILEKIVSIDGIRFRIRHRQETAAVQFPAKADKLEDVRGILTAVGMTRPAGDIVATYWHREPREVYQLVVPVKHPAPPFVPSSWRTWTETLYCGDALSDTLEVQNRLLTQVLHYKRDHGSEEAQLGLERWS